MLLFFLHHTASSFPTPDLPNTLPWSWYCHFGKHWCVGYLVSWCERILSCKITRPDIMKLLFCYRYRWAFIGTAGEEDYITVYDSDDPSWRPNPLFMPHIIRLSRLINSTVSLKSDMFSCFRNQNLFPDFVPSTTTTTTTFLHLWYPKLTLDFC